jgi:hypothetical protein
VGLGERGWKWVSRHPAVAALTAAVALSLLLGASVAAVFGVMANEKAKDARREANRADREATEAKRLAGEEKQAREEAGKQWTRAEREAKEAKRLAKEAQANERAAKAEAHRANVSRHGLQLTVALQAWQQHDQVMAETTLGEVLPAFQQTWEYLHVRDLCRRKAVTLRGHTNSVPKVAYSPDGRRMVSTSSDKTVKVWDAQTGRMWPSRPHRQEEAGKMPALQHKMRARRPRSDILAPGLSVRDARGTLAEELDEPGAADDDGAGDEVVLVELAALEAGGADEDLAAGRREVGHQFGQRGEALLVDAVGVATLRQTHPLRAEEDHRLLVGGDGGVGHHEGYRGPVSVVPGTVQTDTEFAGHAHRSFR